MTDIENDVYDYVVEYVQARHSDLTDFNFSSIEVLAPSRFPFVSIVEQDNRVFDRWRTVERIENATVVMLEANVYADNASGKKQLAKAISNTVDDAFASLGFERTLRYPAKNYNDPSIYRLVSRYQALAIPNDDGHIYIHSY